jgi:hypothetical protein
VGLEDGSREEYEFELEEKGEKSEPDRLRLRTMLKTVVARLECRFEDMFETIVERDGQGVN